MIKPLFNQILVSPEKDNVALAQEASFLNYGIVEDIGEDVKVIKKGDKIAFTIWGLNHISINEKTYYFLPENPDFLLGIITDDE